MRAGCGTHEQAQPGWRGVASEAVPLCACVLLCAAVLCMLLLCCVPVCCVPVLPRCVLLCVLCVFVAVCVCV